MTESVRRWTAADVPAVRELLRQSWGAAYGAFIPPEDLFGYLESTYAVDALRRLIADPEVTGYVGVRDAEVVAVMRVRNDEAEGRTYVSSIYVLPAAQGTGWGRRLMAVAAREANARGRRELWLGVMTQNLPALAWYRRHGFVAEHEEPFRMGGTIVPHLIGHLPIGAFLSSDPSGDER